jgi:peptidoglycan/LPS O-acetylase OafA/YrhL
MKMFASRLLRVALVVLVLGAVVAQVLVWVVASEEGRIFPEVAYLVVPYSVAGFLFIGCGQVALLAVWRLLSMVKGGDIFTRRALRWVDVITACAAVATVLSAGLLIHMLSFVPGGGGPTVYFLGACVAGGLAFVLLMVVMRGLLESAIADRTELDEVI